MTKTQNVDGTDGPLTAQINQAQLTPSVLRSKSHWLQWHLLLGVQLYNLVLPPRVSKATICSPNVGSPEYNSYYFGLTPEWGNFQPFNLWLASEPITQDLLIGQGCSPLGDTPHHTPMYKVIHFSDSTQEVHFHSLLNCILTNPYFFYSMDLVRSQKFHSIEKKIHLIMKGKVILFSRHRKNAYMLMTKISISLWLFSPVRIRNNIINRIHDFPPNRH